jgi:hypothetical protein
MEFPMDVRVVERASGAPAVIGYLIGLVIGAVVAIPIVLLLFAPKI